MRPQVFQPASRFRATLSLPGDKSIAHRCLLISALAHGRSIIENFPANEDCLATFSALQKLGLRIKKRKSKIIVYGKGLRGLTKPKGHIFAGDSGTTLRLLLGVLSGQHFSCRLTAASSLNKRPMLRVIIPLRMMGAQIHAKLEEYPPISIKGGNLKAINYKMPLASAQVKSAILLAALYTGQETKIIEPIPTRDHTERLLKIFGARIKYGSGTITIRGNQELTTPGKLFIPGDISSASFFMVLAAISKDSRIRFKNLNLNPSRAGVIKVLKRMGARVRVSEYQSIRVSGGEPRGDVIVESSRLKGTVISKKEIPSLIDELPVLMVAASLAKGRSVFQSVEELRVKETDRIKSMSENLKAMGAKLKLVKGAGSEDMLIYGCQSLKGARLKSFGDHRTAMSMAVAALAAQGPSRIDDVSCIDKSFPSFIALLKGLVKN